MLRFPSLCAATFVVAWTAAFAQGPTGVPAAPVQNAGAVPRYVSPLADYRAFADTPVASWREANETVRRIGGWQAYSRESYRALRSRAQQAPAERDPHEAHHGVKR